MIKSDGLVEKIAKGKLIKIGGKVFGKAFVYVNYAITARSAYKLYKSATKNDPDSRTLKSYQFELDHWKLAADNLGRKIYSQGDIVPIGEKNAIHELGAKEQFYMSQTRYAGATQEEPNAEVHVSQSGIRERFSDLMDKTLKAKEKRETYKFIQPDPIKASEYVNKAMAYVAASTNSTFSKTFKKEKDSILNNLISLDKDLSQMSSLENISDDELGQMQIKILNVSRSISEIELDYQTKISDLRKKIIKSRAKHGAVSVISAALGTGGAKKF